MNEEDVLLPSTNVINWNINEASLNTIVSYLEENGGDVECFSQFDSKQTARVLFQVEKRLKEHKKADLKERWDDAIDLFHNIKMRMFKRDAIKKLENIDSRDEKQARTDLAFVKLVLGDALAADLAIAKTRASQKTTKSSSLDDVVNDLEDDED